MEPIQETAEGEATSCREVAAAASEPSGDAAASWLRHGMAAVKLEDCEEASGHDCTVSGSAELGGESGRARSAAAASCSAVPEADATAASVTAGLGDGSAAPGEDGAAGEEAESEEAAELALAPARSRRSARAAVRSIRGFGLGLRHGTRQTSPD